MICVELVHISRTGITNLLQASSLERNSDHFLKSSSMQAQISVILK